MTMLDRLKKSWDAFLYRDVGDQGRNSFSRSNSYNPGSPVLGRGNDRTIVASIYNQIAIDCAAVEFQHIRTDSDGRYLSTVKSSLNDCLNVEANLDQASSAFKLDMVLTLCDAGVMAVVPTRTSGEDPKVSDAYDVLEMRVGRIVEWAPRHVKVSVYRDYSNGPNGIVDHGEREEIWLPKRLVAIVENPLATTMNNPNSTLQRLLRKLNYLDQLDEAASSGKLDLLIQLPYTIKTETRRQQAMQRRQDIEVQLQNSKYGVAYIDSAERVTQLNRPVENNLLNQIDYLTKQVYAQMGLNESVFSGEADGQTMTNYNERTIKPIVRAIAEEFHRKFLSKTARSQNQQIWYYRDPFAMIPIDQFAELVDKLTRNEVATSNEMRMAMGWKPVDDPKADMLINSNLSMSTEDVRSKGLYNPKEEQVNDKE